VVSDPGFDSTAGAVSNDYFRGDARQRSAYCSKLLTLSIRISMEDLDKIDYIRQKISIASRGEVVRQAISLYYNLLNNVGEARVGTIVIQNPVVNINQVAVKAEARAGGVSDSLAEVANLVSKLYSLRSTLPPLQRQLVEELYDRVKKIILS